MTLRLYDTATRSLREFTPLVPGQASIYLCGATVQSPPHIGHVRSAVNFDILRRWLEFSGFGVTFIRNVTDIDDKILTKSTEHGQPWWAWAAEQERNFREAYDALGCLPPTYEPRATGHITEMVGLMQRLIGAGHAYATDGDVYFDVRSFPDYGALSGQKIDAMQPAGDSVGDSRKRDPRDFALWKGAKPGEPSWPTPWGDGRPGWHLECSAMAERYLGPAFDIHGGGLDLIFPHHENEIAQSVAAGDGFASCWMHNAWVTTGGEKMSKSLGNSLLVTEMVKRWRPVELRYYLGAAHYRSHIEYSETALNEAASAYRRIESFFDRAFPIAIPDKWYAYAPRQTSAAFNDAMNDDLGVPAALAVLHGTVRAGNTALDAGDESAIKSAFMDVWRMTDVLGIHPRRPPWTSTTSDLASTVDALVTVALGQRAAARERKDFAASDAIRDQLAEAGVQVEDTPSGPRWTLKDS